MPAKEDVSSSPLQPKEEMVSFTVRYKITSLERLKLLQDLSRINAREWCRALMDALLESYEQTGHIELPLAVLSRKAAEEAGLLRASEPGSTEHQQREG